MSVDEFYNSKYREVHNTGLTGIISRFSHRSLEKNISGSFSTVLELGAGDGFHSDYVKYFYDVYYETDIRIKNKLISNKMVSQYCDAEDIKKTFNDTKFDRILMMCLICHLDKIELSLKSIANQVNDGGLISIYVPCEGGFFLSTARKLITNPKTRRIGFDPIKINQLEHLHSYVKMKETIEEVYKNSKITKKNYPFPFLSWKLNLWSVFQVRVNL